MRTFVLLGLGAILGAAALGAIWAATNTATVDVRIVAERQTDGDVAFALQQRGADGEWGEDQTPTRNILTTQTPAGERRHSSTLTLAVEVESEPEPTLAQQVEAGHAARDRFVAEDYAEYLHSSGADYGAWFADYLARQNKSGSVVCVEDLDMRGSRALCDGFGEGYEAGDVVTLDNADDAGLRAQIRGYIQGFDDGTNDLVGLMAPSLAMTQLIAGARDAVLGERSTPQVLPILYWIELVDPHLPDPEALYCIATHGGRDLFWGLASESQEAAAHHLNLNVRARSFAEVGDQAEFIRECVEDGAAAIATTLAEPGPLAQPIAEAQRLGIPVITFNSGAGVVQETNAALHFGLDDRRAGELAGEEFNQRGFDGTILCVLHEPNNVGLHDRCDGLEAAYDGEVERWQADDDAVDDFEELFGRVNAGDLQAILALSSTSGGEVAYAVQLSDHDIKIATFGFNLNYASRVIDGRMEFLIFDQPEIQAYLSSVFALFLDRMRIPSELYFNGMTVLIEPKLADAAYIKELLDSIYTPEQPPDGADDGTAPTEPQDGDGQ